jgi:SAM-dependent methyltransferase
MRARLLRVPSLARRGRERIRAGRWVLANRHLAAKFLPLDADKGYAVLTRSPSAPIAEDGRPAPPEELWRRWGFTLESYLSDGRRDVETMFATLAEVGVDTAAVPRILDFGCAEGRMLRFLDDGVGRELWGVDVNAERIAWAQQHLSPPLRLATTTTAPHLPFPDNYFDLVYALSVFTHISELADAWFLELLRVLRPGGHAYVTIHDEHSVEVLLERSRAMGTHRDMVALLDRFESETGVLSSDWLYFAINADPGAQVFYRADDLVRRWSLLADFRLRKPEASAYQSALVFRKGSSSAPDS